MKIYLFIISLIFSFSVMATNSIELFKSNSYNNLMIKNDHPFIMVLWSLDCPPCIKELNNLGVLYKQNPDLKLTLVSTDSISRLNEINKTLDNSGLSTLDNWVFSDESAQKLRFTIDPTWYGELPRSYFHEQGYKRLSVSGLLDSNKIIEWFKVNS